MAEGRLDDIEHTLQHRNEKQFTEKQLEKVLDEVKELKMFCLYQHKLNKEMQLLLKVKPNHKMAYTNMEEDDDTGNTNDIRLRGFTMKSSDEGNKTFKLQESLSFKWNKGHKFSAITFSRSIISLLRIDS